MDYRHYYVLASIPLVLAFYFTEMGFKQGLFVGFWIGLSIITGVIHYNKENTIVNEILKKRED